MYTIYAWWSSLCRMCTFYFSVPACCMHNCSSLACSMHGNWICATSPFVIPVSACSIHCTCTLQVKFQMLHLNPLKPVAPISIMELQLRDVTSCSVLWREVLPSVERAGQGEMGGCTWRVQTAWPHLGSAVEMTWLALGVRNKQSHLVGPPFPAFKACFSAKTGWHILRDN